METGIFKHPARLPAVCLVLALATVSCSSVTHDQGSRARLARWDVSRAEVLSWTANVRGFDQDHAVEASGIAASGRFLYATAEKYGALIRIDPRRSYAAEVLRLGVPPLSELEGVTAAAGRFFLCDEAHAAVYAVELGDEEASAAREAPLHVVHLPLVGVEVEPGKIGFEGVAATPDGRQLFLLLERSRRGDGSCAAEIFDLRLADGRLVASGDPLQVALEDCNWRLSDLALDHGRLLALKTQYPGERYQVIEIDPADGTWEVALDLTEFARAREKEGFGNNLEGLAVAGDGALFLVSDNAETGTNEDPFPPPAEDRTLFVRLPRARR